MIVYYLPSGALSVYEYINVYPSLEEEEGQFANLQLLWDFNEGAARQSSIRSNPKAVRICATKALRLMKDKGFNKPSLPEF